MQRSQRHAPGLGGRKRYYGLLGLLAALVWFSAGLLGAQAADPPLTVTGSLVDERGAAVDGVEVVLRPYPSTYDLDLSLLAEAETLPEPADRTVSGPDGTFVVSAHRVGPYRLEIHSTPPESQGAVAVPLVYLDLVPLKLPRHLEPIELPDRRPLTVRVSGPDDQPIAGAVVLVDFTAREAGQATLPDWSTEGPHLQPQRLFPELDRASIHTDAEGVARFLAPSAEANVVVSAPGLTARSSRTDSGRVAMRLDPESAITLRVRRPDGSPARQVVVRSGAGPRLPLAVTDDQGKATIRLESGGRQSFESEAADGAFARSVAPPMAPNGTPREGAAAPRILEMQLRTPSSIAGRVTHSATGLVVPGAAVWVRSDPGRGTLAGQLGGFDLNVPVRADRASLDAVGEARPDEWLLGAHREDQVDLGVAAAGYMSVTAKVSLQVASEQSIGLTAAAPLGGWITDDSGRALAGANVQALPMVAMRVLQLVGGFGRATSGADGSFWIDGAVYSHPYELTVTAEGFAPTAVELAPVEAGAAANPARIVLTRGRQPWGTVVGSEGAAVVGATAALFWPLDASERYLFRKEATEPVLSNARGEFEFSDVAPGPYSIDISHPDHVDVQGKTIHVPHGDGYADLGVFTLLPGLEIHGVVADASGRRIEGARVKSVQRARDVAGQRQTRTAVTDEDGNFRLPGQLPVLADLTATADGYSPGFVSAVRPPTSEPVLIELSEGASLAGRVLTPEGGPASGVDVRLSVPWAELSRLYVEVGQVHSFHEARTDGDGHFRFDSLVPTVWSVVVSDKTGRSAHERIELRQGEVREVLFELTTPDRLMVSVTNHIGEPVAGAAVTVELTVPSEDHTWGRTDAAGQVSLPITVGETTVKVEHADLLAQTREVVLNPGDNELHVRLDRGWEISGMVRSTGGGVVPGATVEAEKADPGVLGRALESDEVARALRGSLRLLQPPTQAVSAADGRFRLVGLDRGRYSLVARLPGYAESQAARTVEIDGHSVAGVEIVLEPGASIRGAVTGLGPSELATAEVLAWGGAPEVLAEGGTLFRSAIPDSEGRFELEAMAPGAWRLVAVADDRRTLEQGVTLEPGAAHPAVELRFEQGFRLTGQVLVAGQPASGSFVSAARPDQKRSWRARTDHQGRFEIQGLPAGSYRLSLWHGSGVGVAQTVDLQGDHYGLVVNLAPRPANPH